MAYNEIFNMTIDVSIDKILSVSIVKFKTKLLQALNTIGNCLSYVIYSVFAHEDFIGYKVKFNITENKKFNELTPDEICDNVTNVLYSDCHKTKHNPIVGYGQSSSGTLVKVYNSLLKDLANKQHHHWQQLECDDLYQMACFTLYKLYRRGYYIHKRLLVKAFNNEVLHAVRPDKNKLPVISIERERDENGEVKLKNIPDTTVEEERDAEEENAIHLQIISEMRDLIIDIIGPRQYDQLLREYGSKTTSVWGRKTMLKIKAKLFEMGISIKSFDRYYGG